jgi:AraC family transcriptional regulator
MDVDPRFGISVSAKRFESEARLSEHVHESAYCCLLLRGTAEEQLNGRRVGLEPSSFSVRPPNSSHSVSFGCDGAFAVILELDSYLFDRLRRGVFPPWPGVWRAPAGACVAAARISKELPARDLSARLIVEGLTLELLGSVMRNLPPRKKSLPPEWLRQARERIVEEPEKLRSIAELARSAGVHPGYFATAFRSWYHESPGELVRRMRLEGATELLRTTDLSIAEIASRSGYYDQSHFTNDLQRRCGVSPGVYRKAMSATHERI